MRSRLQIELERGLTLIELIVAMALFSVMGLFLFNLMARSLEIYRGSSQSAEFYDKFDSVSRQLEDDLRCTWIGDPEGRGPKSVFLADYDRKYVPSETSEEKEAAAARNAWTADDPRSFALRFIRTFPGGENSTTLGRFAGTYSDQEMYLDGVDDDVESRADAINAESRERLENGGSQPRNIKSRRQGSKPPEPGLLAPRGLMEVLYFLDRGENDTPGTFTLYRAIRSPTGGVGSFLAPGFLRRMSPEWIVAHAVPVVSGLAHFGIVFWTQDTKEWDLERALDRGAKAAARGNIGSEARWDSTRSRSKAFGMYRGEDSAQVWEDDVFPVRAQLVMTFLREGRGEGEARTLGATSRTARRLQISNRKIFKEWDRGGPRFLQVGSEWMEVVGAEGRELEVLRGIRRSVPQKHESGTDVRVGRRFKKVVQIPAHRAAFRLPGDKK
ncbi:MAG: prepilin-type N-terminal cleavage/methylation domain-containing protein [Planctomycetota bacterium]